MLGRELCPVGPFGGILADQMGLGKTIQVLVTILCNRPSTDERRKGSGATLIIARANLIEQWMDETRKHCVVDPDDRKSISIKHYRKTEKTVTKKQLQDFDIV